MSLCVHCPSKGDVSYPISSQVPQFCILLWLSLLYLVLKSIIPPCQNSFGGEVYMSIRWTYNFLIREQLIVEIGWLMILIFLRRSFHFNKSLIHQACFWVKWVIWHFTLKDCLLGIRHAHTLLLALSLGPWELEVGREWDLWVFSP